MSQERDICRNSRLNFTEFDLQLAAQPRQARFAFGTPVSSTYQSTGEATMTDYGDHEHPYSLMIRPPCPCPTNMTLDPDALADPNRQNSHATALLLAGETFLNAAQDPHKPLELRAQLEKAAFKLLAESAHHILQSRKSD